jgi:hypothetical protein
MQQHFSRGPAVLCQAGMRSSGVLPQARAMHARLHAANGCVVINCVAACKSMDMARGFST